ncbi:hypothetical protein P7C71_g3553, partial [Lecanoromycetidae sp. Uapishka_2]
MLFTQMTLIALASLASAAHLHNHAYHHRTGAASLTVSSPFPPPSNLVNVAGADDDKQDDCDAYDDDDESGEKSDEGTIASNPAVNEGSGTASASSSTSSASATASQSSVAVLNAGVVTNEKDAQQGGQDQNQASSSSSASVSASQYTSSSTSTSSASTSSPSTPVSSNGGTPTEQKDAVQAVGANQDANIQIIPNPSSSSTAAAAAASSSTLSTSAASGGGSTSGSFTASFTEYGSNDADGSGNCNTASAACGFYNNPGYNAAISQAVFGAGPGGGAGPACGHCYKLMPDAPSANSIVVKVNNLCPDDGNPMCNYPENVDVNFDLCKDDLAASGLFGTAGPFQVNGTAVQVDCSEWSGGADLS